MATSGDTSKGLEQSGALPVRMASKVEDAAVHLTNNDRLLVEFRIEDLVKRLVPNGSVASSCGGCNGCSGCSM